MDYQSHVALYLSNVNYYVNLLGIHSKHFSIIGIQYIFHVELKMNHLVG